MTIHGVKSPVIWAATTVTLLPMNLQVFCKAEQEATGRELESFGTPLQEDRALHPSLRCIGLSIMRPGVGFSGAFGKVRIWNPGDRGLGLRKT